MNVLLRRARTRRRPVAARPPSRIWEDIADELPEEDLGEDLRDSLERYSMGSKPRCEEREYLELMEDAIERLARGR